MTDLRERLSGRGTELLLIVFVIVAGAGAGVISVHKPKLGAVAVAALVVLMLSARRPVTLAIVAVVGVFFVRRLGGTSVNPGSSGGISYADALVAAAAALAVPALIGTPELRRLRIAMQGTAVYLALLLPTIITNPSTRAYLEWSHRLVLVGGSLLVGAWIVREQVVPTAMRCLTFIACAVGLAAIVDTFQHGFHPATPYGLNKNLIGALLACVIVVLVVAARTVELSPRLRIVGIVLVGGGLLASQSRGGELAAALGLLAAFAINPKAHSNRVKILTVAVGIALAVGATLSIQNQFKQDKVDFNNNSIGVRYNVERVTLDIWRTSPIVGVGLKYFNTHNFGRFAVAPNNFVDNELAESGAIGLGGFVLMQIMLIGAAIKRRGDPLGAAAVGILFGQLLHGSVDIYWSAGSASLPFLLLGIALGSEPSTPGLGERRKRLGEVVGSHRGV